MYGNNGNCSTESNCWVMRMQFLQSPITECISPFAPTTFFEIAVYITSNVDSSTSLGQHQSNASTNTAGCTSNETNTSNQRRKIRSHAMENINTKKIQSRTRVQLKAPRFTLVSCDSYASFLFTQPVFYLFTINSGSLYK